MLAATPPSAADIKIWFDFFTTMAGLLSPIMVAALGALTLYFGKRQAAKADVARATQISSAQAYQTNTLVIRGTTATQQHDEKLDEIKDVAEKTHILVNGQHGMALQTILEQAKRLADLTKTPADAAAVVIAQENLDLHNSKIAAAVDPKGKL